MSKPEQKLQIQAANYLKLRYPSCLWTISPVGLIIGRNLGMLAVRMGYQKGTPDVIILEPRGPYHGLVIEIKWGDNTTSPEQDEFLDRAKARGYLTAVCYTHSEIVKTVDEYLALPIPGLLL